MVDMAKAKVTTGPTAAQVLFLAMCRQHGLPEPVPEYQFHEERKWLFDYAWRLVFTNDSKFLKVALEIEGGVFGVGPKCPSCGRRKQASHSGIETVLSDMEKYNEAAVLGWTVVRCVPDSVNDGSVFDLLKRVLT